MFSAIVYVVVLIIWGHIFTNIKFKQNLSTEKGSIGHLYTRLKEVKKIKDVDVLFLGSSHAYRGFDPRIFNEHGISSFNLGSSAQTALQTKVLLNRYLENINPKTIVYEVYPNSFSSDGVESSLDLLANDVIDKNAMKMAFKINHIKTYNALIYYFISNKILNEVEFVEKEKKGNDSYVSGGFVEKKITYFKTKSQNERSFKFNTNQLNDLKDIINLIKDKKYRLILVYAPITPSLYKSNNNNVEYDSIMNNLSEYYNFNELIVLNDSTCFYDPHHMNQNGVKLFNNKMLEVIDFKK
jgi:hypothetical protein